MDQEGIRINKYLSEAGVCSRREADRKIIQGSVTVNDRQATPGTRVNKDDIVKVDSIIISNTEKPVLIAFNKPKGIVCTAEKREKNNIIDFINYPTRIYPVGRLDKDSTGLILLTNQGELVNKIMRAGNFHEKEYLVKVNKKCSDDFLNGLRGGVPLKELNVTTRKCKVERVDDYKFKIILTQGLNRQIRRMCEYFDYRVLELERIRVLNIKLGNLKQGTYRNITENEYKELLGFIENSRN